MIRAAYNALKRIFPGGAAFLREAFFTLNGWRLEQLQRKIHLQSKASSHADFMTQNSMDRLSTTKPHAAESIAVISPLPPAETGIATCTMESFFPATFGVDLYSSFNNPYEYLLSVHNPRLQNTNLRIFHLNSLPYGHLINKYKAIVFTFGNSDHNVEIVNALLYSKVFPFDVPVFAYIHDPCILNVLEQAIQSMGGSIESVLRTAYPEKAGIISAAIRAKEPGQLVREGIYGVRALAANGTLSGIIVNSAAARDLLMQDLGDQPAPPVLQAFHPVFGVPFAGPPANSTSDVIKIGTFGVPSPTKGTDLVLAAFRILRAKGLKVELLMAGYGAERFYEIFQKAGDEGITVVDSPSDEAMEAMMRSVDVAVQLRRQNLGESSGAVPRMLYYGKPTIVSAIGSFKEFGDAVRQVDPAINPEDLASAIEEELRTPKLRDAARARYVQEHSPERFCQTILSMADAYESAISHVVSVPQQFASGGRGMTKSA